MGELAVKAITTEEEKQQFIHYLLNDIRALDILIGDDLFEKGKQRIGAEQEMCVLKDDFHPSRNGPEILSEIDDRHFTTEIGRFNLECNLDPFELKTDCFRLTERQLVTLLAKAKSAASGFGDKILLAGILPTIQHIHLGEEYMTPWVRYKVISDIMRSIRGGDFEIHIQGVDELIARLDSVLFEACNTSFQMHLQVAPEDFVQQYNWAQHISGPVLAVGANSPLLLGRELWMETRIALFQQSIDTRSSTNHLREKQPRVRFGSDWLWQSASELFKDNISRFPLIMTTDVTENALETLKAGKMPKLKALQLHNGTTYTWNRICYGFTNGLPHLRIENRYLPSGPSVPDELANFAFWIGLQKGLPEKFDGFFNDLSFKTAKDNFYRAAKTGMDTIFDWFGKAVVGRELLLDELLPIAHKGLESVHINTSDIDHYLGIIEQRILKRQNGAQWQVRNFRKLKEAFGLGLAIYELTRGMYFRQEKGEPVHLWSDIDSRRYYPVSGELDTVGKIMTIDLFTVREDESLDLVSSIMEWKNIRHLLVEDSNGDLVGLVTATNLKECISLSKEWEKLPVGKIMIKNLVTVASNTPFDSAVRLMEIHGIGCLPVVENRKLLGLITDTDIAHCERKG